MTSEQIISDILKREGGLSDHPNDRGGLTKHGVTKRKLSEVRGRPVSDQEVISLTESEARTIYRTDYIEKPGYEQITDQALQGLMVDSAVQHGPFTASRWLQAAAGTKQDGQVGPKTIAALNASDAREVYRSVLRSRMEFYGSLISRDRSQAVFALGWLRRLSLFV